MQNLYRIITTATFTTILLLTYLPISAHFKGGADADANEISSFAYALAVAFILILFTTVSTIWLLATVLVDSKTSILKRYLTIRVPYLLLSRLAYGLYFLNALPIWFNAATSRNTAILSWSFLVSFQLSLYDIVCIMFFFEQLGSTFQNILQTLMLAIFVFLFVEAPLKRLNSLFFTS